MDIPVSKTSFNPFTYVNNGCTYILYNLSNIGTTNGSIQFTVPKGIVYMAIQGFPGSAGSSDGDGGGGGGGSGGFFNGQITNTTSATMMYVNITYSSISLNSSISLSYEETTSPYLSIPNGTDGGNGTSGNGGNGGNGGSWASQLTSTSTLFSNFTANGGGGGGGGNNNDNSSGNGAGGTGGASAGYFGNSEEPTTETIGYYTFLDDAYGLNGPNGSSVGSGATLYNFLDGSNELMEAGQGAYTSLATNGSFPYIMFYRPLDFSITETSSEYTFLNPTAQTTSPVSLSVYQYRITSTTTTASINYQPPTTTTTGPTTTQKAVDCISNTTYNPLTYAVPDNWAYSMICCPTCTYNAYESYSWVKPDLIGNITTGTTDSTTTIYYEATWTVPSSGTYYWAGIGPGGTANIAGNYYNGADGLFGGDGGSGNGCFVTGQLINGQIYTFQMYDTTVSTTMPTDTAENNSTTYNTLIGGTNNMSMSGGGIGGCGLGSSTDLMYGGNGGNGGTTTYSSGASITDFFSVSTSCSGSGGGGGSCAGGGGGVPGLGGTQNGTDGSYESSLNNSELYVGYDDMISAGQGGLMNLSFYDSSSINVQAGNGSIMLNNTDNTDTSDSQGETYLTIYATSGIPTWMMIYYQPST